MRMESKRSLITVKIYEYMSKKGCFILLAIKMFVFLVQSCDFSAGKFQNFGLRNNKLSFVCEFSCVVLI